MNEQCLWSPGCKRCCLFEGKLGDINFGAQNQKQKIMPFKLGSVKPLEI